VPVPQPIETPEPQEDPRPVWPPVATSGDAGAEGLAMEQPDPEVFGAERLGPDLRWRRCPAEVPQDAGPLVEIAERDVADELDARWALLTVTPG